MSKVVYPEVFRKLPTTSVKDDKPVSKILGRVLFSFASFVYGCLLYWSSSIDAAGRFNVTIEYISVSIFAMATIHLLIAFSFSTWARHLRNWSMVAGGMSFIIALYWMMFTG